MINRHKGQIRVGQSGPIVVGNLPPEQSPPIARKSTKTLQKPSIVAPVSIVPQTYKNINVEKFNILVDNNKASGRSWYYGLEGTWWWGMTEEDVRRKILEGKDMTYAHPNVAIAIPHLKPKIISQPTQQPHSQPVITISKIAEDGPKIAIVSIVRDEDRSGSLKRFLDCCQELEQYHKNIVYIFIEGDSSDRTYDVLKDWIVRRNSYILEKQDRGHAPFGKSRDRRRTDNLARLRNRLMELVLSISDISEILVIDANYGWKGDLISSLRETNADIAAPLVVAHKHGNGKYIFYDVWAFRKNGRNFGSFYPYMKGIESGNPIDIDSAGGGYLVKRQVLDAGVRYSGGDCEHVLFCKSAKKLGFSIKINPNVYIRKGGHKE